MMPLQFSNKHAHVSSNYPKVLIHYREISICNFETVLLYLGMRSGVIEWQSRMIVWQSRMIELQSPLLVWQLLLMGRQIDAIGYALLIVGSIAVTTGRLLLIIVSCSGTLTKIMYDTHAPPANAERSFFYSLQRIAFRKITG